MKPKTKKLLLWMFAAFPLTLSAQVTLTELYNQPRPGDRLVKKQVAYTAPGDSGKSVRWDFSDLKVIDKDYELRYDTVHSNYWIGRENRTMYYYSLQNDTFALCGHENPTTLFTYRKPETQLVFPFPYGRTLNSYFDATGKYCDRVNMHIAGKTTVTADATGEILLPGGDTLRHVLRVHSHKSLLEYSLTHCQAVVLNDSLCPVMQRDSIDYHLANDSVVWQIDTWKWYTEGYRYPVFETVEASVHINKEINRRLTNSFYYPPHEQYYALNYDLENQTRRDSRANDYTNRYDDDTPPQSGNSYKDETIHYSYSIDAQGNLQISYTPAEAAEVQFALYNMQGQQLSDMQRQSPGQQLNRESIPLHSFPAGEYLLQIVCNGKRYGEKILKQ